MYLGFGVDRVGSFIKYQQCRTSQNCSGEGYELALPLRELCRSLSYLCIQPVLQLFDEWPGTHRFSSGRDFILARRKPAVANILADGSGEKLRCLQYIAQL